MTGEAIPLKYPPEAILLAEFNSHRMRKTRLPSDIIYLSLYKCLTFGMSTTNQLKVTDNFVCFLEVPHLLTVGDIVYTGCWFFSYCITSL